MATNTAIGNAIGIPFKRFVQGNKINISPELLDSLCGVWIADQNTNESPTRNIIKNKLPNKGGDFEILNAAYGGMSGFNGYDYDFNSDVFIEQPGRGIKLNDHTIKVLRVKNFIFMNVNLHNITIKIKVTGLDEAKNRNEIAGQFIIYNSTTDTGKTIIRHDGIYEVDVQSGVDTGNIYFYIPAKDIAKEQILTSPIVVEEVARYQGSFVTDGVEDMIVSQKTVSEMLNGSNEVTVISMFKYLDDTNSDFTNLLGLTGLLNTVRAEAKYKCYICGYASNSITTINNKTTINSILGDKRDIDSRHTIVGNLKNKYSITGYITNNGVPINCRAIAYYGTFIANKVLTTDEINQVIAYYNLDKYVAPDIYYDVKKQGLTNENHAEFGDKLIDYSDNGRDMQLYNIGWEGMSGANGYPVVFGKNKTWINSNNGTNLQVTLYPTYMNISRISFNQALLFTYIKTNGTIIESLNKEFPSFKIKVNGLIGDFSLNYRYIDETGVTIGDFRIISDGEYTLPKSHKLINSASNDVWVGFICYSIKGGTVYDCNVTIEVLPEYENAVVFDGVEDYGQYVGDLGLKDYTVVADRAYSKILNRGIPIISSTEVKIDTPFIMEYYTNSNIVPYSFGTNIVLEELLNIDREISYQSTYVYNGNSINRGTSINTGKGLTFGRFGAEQQHAALCLYSFMLFPYTLSEFLLERQLKKRKLGTLYPDMVEFRPIITGNVLYAGIQINQGANVLYFDNTTNKTGEYLKDGSIISIFIKPNGISEISEIVVNGVSYTDLPINSNGYYYINVPITKSPQKISYVIDEYIRYEDIVMPYPFIPNLYWDDEFKNPITYGDKLKVGSTIYGHLDRNLLPKLYTRNRMIYKGTTVNRLPIVVEKQMVFDIVSKVYLKDNEPKSILSPERLSIPNSSYKLLGYIPDISGHGNHGRLNNSAYAEGSGVNADGSYGLDGVDDFISIPTLSAGGKQVLMKVNWKQNSGMLYDQRIDTTKPWLFGIYCDDSIAYSSRNTNGQTYIDGVLNQQINALNLISIKHNITVTNINTVDSKTKSPIIGSNFTHTNAFTLMSLYTFMLFNEISTEEEIKELNDIVGIEGNIDMSTVDFTTYASINTGLTFTATEHKIHLTHIQGDGPNPLRLFRNTEDTFKPFKIQVSGITDDITVAYLYDNGIGYYYENLVNGTNEISENYSKRNPLGFGFSAYDNYDCDIIIEFVELI